MGKRAKQKALEAYPNLGQPEWDEMSPRLLFTRYTERDAFIKGYEQAEKDIKEQMIPVTALVNESKDFLSLSLSTEEYEKIGRRFKAGEDVEIYIKRV